MVSDGLRNMKYKLIFYSLRAQHSRMYYGWEILREIEEIGKENRA